MSRKAKSFSNSEIFIGFHLLEPVFNNYENFPKIRSIVHELILNEIECFDGMLRNQCFRANDSAAVLAYRHLKYVASELYPTDNVMALEKINNESLFSSVDSPGTKYDIKPHSPSLGQFCANKDKAHFSAFFSNHTMPVIMDDKSFIAHIKNICLLRDEKTLPLLSNFAPAAFAAVAQDIELKQQIRKKKEELSRPAIRFLSHKEDCDLVKKRIEALGYFITEIPEYDQVPTAEIISAVEWCVLRIKLERHISGYGENIPKNVAEFYDSLHKYETSPEKDLQEASQEIQKHLLILNFGTIPTLTNSTIKLINHIKALPAYKEQLNIMENQNMVFHIEFIKATACLEALKIAYKKQQEIVLQSSIMSMKSTGMRTEPSREEKKNTTFKRLLAEAIETAEENIAQYQCIKEQLESLEAKLKSPLNHLLIDEKIAQQSLRKKIKEIKDGKTESGDLERSFSMVSFSSISSHNMPLPLAPVSSVVQPLPSPSSWRAPLPPLTLQASESKPEINKTSPEIPVTPTRINQGTKFISSSLLARVSLFNSAEILPGVKSPSPGKLNSASTHSQISSLNLSQVLKPRTDLFSQPRNELDTTDILMNRVSPRIAQGRRKPTKKIFVNTTARPSVRN
jgi:hypothetical protein